MGVSVWAIIFVLLVSFYFKTGVFVGAVIGVLLLSLLFRKVVVRILGFNNKAASTISSVVACILFTAIGYLQSGGNFVLFYPLAGILVWIYLFFDLPFKIRNKGNGNSS